MVDIKARQWGHVTGWRDESHASDPGCPRRGTDWNIKHDQYITAGGGVYNEPHSSLEVCAPNATGRPCKDDVEHATMQVTKRDNGAALLRLRHVSRRRQLQFWILLVRFCENGER